MCYQTIHQLSRLYSS